MSGPTLVTNINVIKYNLTINGDKMLGEFKFENVVDDSGNPTGGSVRSVGLNIDWQNGPLGRGIDRKEPNGAFVETVIAAVRQRIAFYNAGKFSCRENSMAITKLDEALMWLDSRTGRREKAGVEGTHAEESKA